MHLSEGTTSVRPPEKLATPPEAITPVEKAPAAAAALPDPERVSVSIDQTREFVYRFVDAKTGEVLSQTPPEAVLKVVREIQNQLIAEEHRKNSAINVRG